MISLCNDGITLTINPDLGGGITGFHWRGQPVLRDMPADIGGGPAPISGQPLKQASFVLLPYSNRIAYGRFTFQGRPIQLRPNCPAASAHHAIHGLGWQAIWQVMARGKDHALLRYDHRVDSDFDSPDPSAQNAQNWPWAFTAEQHFSLHQDSLQQRISVTNRSRRDMPIGLGIHPYFPRQGAKLVTRFAGQWGVTTDGLPTRWSARDHGDDVLQGPPQDSVFTGRSGPLIIDWPSHRLVMTPDDSLSLTHIYTPKDEAYFCVEPVSHMTDAANRDGLRVLAPDETWTTRIDFTLSPAPQ